MRGDDERTDGMFSYVRPEQRVPADHPLRPIREIVDRALEALSARFEALYSRTGRPSIPPEKLEEMRARAKPFTTVATDEYSQTPGFSVRALAHEAKERASRG